MSRVVGLLAALAAMPFAVGVTVGQEPEPAPDVVFAFQDPEIIESSGLVARDGLFATLNDSGDSARVFTLDPATGETVGVTEWDADPVDLEAMAPVGAGEVLVGDIGDNPGQRDSISVTRLPVGEGTPSGPVTTYELVYPDGRHDAESLLVHPGTGQVMVVAKEIIGRLYVAPEELADDRPNRLAEVGEVLPVATDGAFFPRRRPLRAARLHHRRGLRVAVAARGRGVPAAQAAAGGGHRRRRAGPGVPQLGGAVRRGAAGAAATGGAGRGRRRRRRRGRGGRPVAGRLLRRE
ncbi:hypothetical protein MF408_06230 [Nocardioides sp. TF02-7]|nr:hypothetical protein MF408_06230 [Nocardioides sp. TF02-7]